MIFASVAASDKMKPVINVLPDTLDDVSTKLENIGLRIATEKSKFMFRSPPRKYLRKITLTVRPQPLEHAHQHRFLRFMLDAPRKNSLSQVTNLHMKIKCTS